MGTWIKETDQAIYLMQGGYYLEKIEKRPRSNGEKTLSIVDMHQWFARSDAPGGMIVALGSQASEPLPKPIPENGVEITKAPKSVEVKEVFVIEGITSKHRAGQSVHLQVDNQLASSAPKVNEEGKWRINFRFFSQGTRNLKITIDRESVDLVIQVSSLTPQPKSLSLQGSVGWRGVNRAEDVLIVKERLAELGFDFFKPGPFVDTGMLQAIKLFQSIITGKTKLGGDGRVDVGGRTHKFLQAANAPRWMLMPIKGEGFINFEREDLSDHHDYGASWLADTIIAAGKLYETQYRKNRKDISLIPINDVSYPQGGDTPDHAGHEAGNACDVSIPRKGGDFGGIHWRNNQYDRDSTRILLKALRAQPLVTRIFFNDPQLIREGLCKSAAGHDNHIHFEIGIPNPV